MKTLKLFLFFILTCFFLTETKGQAQENKAIPGKQVTINCQFDGDNIDGYLLYLPKSYEKKISWPIIMFLQGGAVLGGEIHRVNQAGIPRMLESEHNTRSELYTYLKDSFIVISPHMIESNSSKRQWYNNTNKLRDILDEVILQYNGDINRVYLTGLSWGGHGTWGVACRLEDRFAAIVPVCGQIHGINNYSALVNIPIWITHCIGDKVYSYSEPLEAVSKIEDLGGIEFLRLEPTSPIDKEYLEHKHILTSFKRDEHNAWTETYNSVELYKWLLHFSLKK